MSHTSNWLGNSQPVYLAHTIANLYKGVCRYKEVPPDIRGLPA